MTKYFEHPLIKKDAVEYRLYQEVIAAISSRKNTLVVLPTGLGKTIIAALVTANRLHRYPDSKVIFLAPTRPLVEQHKKVFEEILDLIPGTINVFTGVDSPSKREKKWHQSKVAIMTPQVLQNDIIAKRYTLENVSLMIFDECHRAVGDYPYVFIAKKYMSTSKYPLILGITASPGSELEKIEEIKKNLFIQQVEVRDEHSPDVAPYIQKRILKWHHIDLPEEFTRIIQILNTLLKDIISSLKEHDLMSTTDIRKIKRKDLILVKEKIQKLIHERTNTIPNEYYRLLAMVTNAIRISHLLELIETQGVTSFYAHLKKLEEKSTRQGAPKTLKEFVSSNEFMELKMLANYLIQKGIEHPKLEHLIKILDEYLSRNENMRILVFTHYRVTAKYISEKLREHGLNAMWFVGQQKRSDVKGLTQKQQLEILENFSLGIYNILVATSVAEEGLDIAECDLVIFYDAVPSAIRRIQRMGRTGRKREGTVIVLIAKGTRDEGYYWASVRKEKKMKEILKKLKKQLSVKEIERSKVAFEASQGLIEEYIIKEKPDMKIMKTEKSETDNEIEIIIDSREFLSEVVRYLSDYDCKITIKRLDVGDYILSDDVIIERKTSSDFVNSIIDNRLFPQIKKLKENYRKPILIIEGYDLFSHRNVTPKSIYSAIAAVAVDFNVPIIWSENAKETAEIIYIIAKREQIEHKRKPVIRAGEKPLLLDDVLEFVIASIPGVDLARSRALLSHFGSIRSIFNASIDELTKVPGIGKKIAEKIFIIANHLYKKRESSAKRKR